MILFVIPRQVSWVLSRFPQGSRPPSFRDTLRAKQERVCRFNPHSLAPNAAIRLSRRCRPMPANSSMTARAVANGSSPSRAIAACSALTAQCRVRRSRPTCVAACQRFINCPNALNARTGRVDVPCTVPGLGAVRAKRAKGSFDDAPCSARGGLIANLRRCRSRFATCLHP